MDINQLKFELYQRLLEKDKQKPFSLNIFDFQLLKILSVDIEVKEILTLKSSENNKTGKKYISL